MALTPEAAGGWLWGHDAKSSPLKGHQKFRQTAGNAADDVAAVSVFRQQKRKLQNEVFFQPDFPPFGVRHLVDGVLGDANDGVDHLLGNGLLVRRRLVLVEERLELERVQLEADGRDGGDVLGCVLPGEQKVGSLGPML